MRFSLLFSKPGLSFLLIFLVSVAAAQDAKSFIDKADGFFKDEKYDLAIANYNKALRLDMKNADAYNGRGLAYNAKGEYDSAILDFNKAISLNPTYSIGYSNRGTAYTNKELFDLSIKDFTSAINQDPNYDFAYAKRGEAYLGKNQFDLAIADFAKAISIDPNYDWAYGSRGNAYAKKKQYELALQDITKAISIDPNYAPYYVDRGIVYASKNQYDLAIQDYSKAIGVDPESATAYTNRGYAYVQKKQPDLALKDYTKAIELDPQYTKAYVSRGDAYLAKGQVDFAIQDYTNAINLEPATALYYVDRGIAYNRINQFDLAIQDYSKAISLSPRYTWAYIDRGIAYSNKKLFDQAIEDYNTASTIEPDNPNSYLNRGFSYSNKRQYDLAIQDFNKAISLGIANASAYSGRGYALSQKYQYELAIQDYSTAINLNPTNGQYYSNRGFYYNNIGKYETSIQDFKTALEKEPNYVYPYINIISPLVRMQRLKEASSIYNQYKQKKLTSYIESDKYKFYKSFITAVTQVADEKLNDALVSLDSASRQYGNEIKEETKRSYIDILFLKGYILERMNRNEEAKIIYEQSLVIDSRQPDLPDALQRLQQKQTVSRNIDKDGPEITLINPAPSRGFDIVSDNAKTQIIGKAKDIAGIKTVTINGAAVEKIEDDGLFIGNLALKSGANSLVITATDKQGNTSSKTFTINTNSVGNITQAKPDMAMGPGGAPKYYAILIAEKDYDDPAIPDLQNPVKDAKELKAILEKNYTFSPANIDTLYNRSREDIMQAIVQRCNTLTENDNLVIFYAGHGIGEKDKFGDVDGYWIPVSARKDLNASYISSDDINKAIKRSNAKHILVIADACFSGAFTRSLPADASKEISKQYAVSSRKIMASGNLEPVPDNSKFLFYLKKSLTENNQKYISAKDLFDGFYKAILSNSDNLPQYAAIKNVGDEGGEFIFIKR